MWGKNADFVGCEQFGNGERKPREIQDAGHVLRIQRRADQPVLAVAAATVRQGPARRAEVGRSWTRSARRRTGGGCRTTILKSRSTGRQIGSVSGGTRWGGGLWINSEDLARFGLLDAESRQVGRPQLVSGTWLKDAVTPSEHGPDYGYLWWLNTKKKQWPSAPASSFAAIGNGSNTIWIDPEHDIVFVWHWHRRRDGRDDSAHPRGGRRELNGYQRSSAVGPYIDGSGTSTRRTYTVSCPR